MSDPKWNEPARTWRLASYRPPTERREKDDRRAETRRAALGDRRRSNSRSLRSLFRL